MGIKPFLSSEERKRSKKKTTFRSEIMYRPNFQTMCMGLKTEETDSVEMELSPSLRWCVQMFGGQ